MNFIKTYKSYFLLISILFSLSAQSQTSPKFKVVLDAGHGNHDFGATYHGFVEKNIALAVVLKVGKVLEEDPNIQVIYTRKDDTFVDLVERANIANRANANLFVSVHCNANKNTDAYGAETYVMGLSKSASSMAVAKKENSVITLESDYKSKYAGYDPNSPESLISATLAQEEYLDQSIELASIVQDNFEVKLDRKVRGVKQAPFMVLHKAFMPRVLIEMGFISNKEEGAYLNSEEGQINIAKSIALAIFRMKVEHFGGNMPTMTIQKSPKPVAKDTTPKPVVKIIDSVKPTNEVPSTTDSNKVVFKIQLKASTTEIDIKPSNFNGLENISVFVEKEMYKYSYGETNSYVVAKMQLLEAKTKGYTSAFIVAFKKGEKITLNEALKSN